MAEVSKIYRVGIDKLIPYENNAKKHSQKQIEKLSQSISEFGFLAPVLIDADNNIIAGHGRVEAAKQIGLDKVPCVRVEGLTDEQRRAYILADNKLSEFGEWDLEMVHALTDHIKTKVGASNLDASSKKIVEDAYSASKGKGGTKKWAGTISGYAKESYAECVAEAVSDWYCNGNKASKASKAIMSELKKYK